MDVDPYGSAATALSSKWALSSDVWLTSPRFCSVFLRQALYLGYIEKAHCSWNTSSPVLSHNFIPFHLDMCNYWSGFWVQKSMFGKLFSVILSIETHPESNLLYQQCKTCCENCISAQLVFQSLILNSAEGFGAFTMTLFICAYLKKIPKDL